MNKYQLLLKDIENIKRQLQHDLPYERYAEFSNDGLRIPNLGGPLKEAEALALARWILEMTRE